MPLPPIGVSEILRYQFVHLCSVHVSYLASVRPVVNRVSMISYKPVDGITSSLMT